MNLGGIETFLMNILRNSDRQIDEYVILTYSSEIFYFEDEIKSLGIRIIRIKQPPEISVWKHITDLRDVIKSENVDVVHAHTYVNSAYVSLAAYMADVKIRISHSHTTLATTETRLRKKLKWAVAKLLINIFATHKIACSKEAGVALFGKRKFIIIPNGIQLSRFYFDKTTRQKIRNELGLGSKTTVIGHVGRFDTPKNHLFLLDIFKSYTHLNLDSKLVLVGSGKLEKEIKRKIDDLKIDNVVLLGDRSDVNTLLNAFDIFVFPSIYEGLPLSLVEVQANGLNSLISDSVANEIKVTKTIHFYSLTKTAEEWANKILGMTVTHQDSSNSKSLRSYSIDNTVNRLMTIYDEGLKK
jgi:glycosyltransferase involved in cell wall biosynthesis